MWQCAGRWCTRLPAAKLHAMLTHAPAELRRVRVASVCDIGIDIRRYDLRAADGRPLPAYDAGSHLDVHVPSGAVRQYSLCGDPRMHDRYTIAVKRERSGRGGSVSMHDSVDVGSVLGIEGPRNLFPLAASATRSLLIAGGIGITPIYAMVQTLNAAGKDWELHYCARSEQHAAFYSELRELSPTRVHTYFAEVPLLDAGGLLRAPDDT